MGKYQMLDSIGIGKFLWDRVEDIEVERDENGRIRSYMLYLTDGCTYHEKKEIKVYTRKEVNQILRSVVIGKEFNPAPVQDRHWRKIDLQCRYEIEELCKHESNRSLIARMLGVSVSSLNYEMERAGMDTYNYNAEEAQRRADNIRRGRPPKNE